MMMMALSTMWRVVGLLLLLIFSATQAASSEEKYSTKYDNIDLQQIVANDHLLKNYVNCLLDQGPCTPDGRELKNNMPDALETNCSKCSEKQKSGSEFIIRYLIDNKPEYWTPLEAKYDPMGGYKANYLATKTETTTANSS